MNEAVAERSPRAGRPIRFLALGDSYTIGEGVTERERWPVRLAAALKQRGHHLREPRILAETGWTTDELAAAMDKADLEARWDLVSLLIGVNNAYRGLAIDAFVEEARLLLDRAIELARGRTHRVFALSIPDWSVTPFAHDLAARGERDPAEEAARIADYNAAQRELTRKRGVAWFDITPSTQSMGNDETMVTEDGLHPSARLYRRWVDEIANDVAAFLSQP